ncbi:hypothetical protein NGF19_12570 [Streptomyces sp. RY43-2]|uniref:Uncharacterized protein n=1 Tax=Streptomyces macrolidinus TaxID=2952607 RepID=A0ABT0ZDF5_9ACTN|nr:DUF6380 family protein [Streptomyces macrolidinus]MCN9241616.1 hypothetical protein [Streptomyces macrolidinus]
MDRPDPEGRIGEKRQATLRCGAASLTETARRASFKHHGGPAGEAAR